MKDGTKIRICDMTDSHIRNTLNFLENSSDDYDVRELFPIYEDFETEIVRRMEALSQLPEKEGGK